MMTLKNGAQVMAKSLNFERGEGVVLCSTQGLSAHPFATWLINREGETYWGNYFLTYAEAQRDYAERVAKLNR